MMKIMLEYRGPRAGAKVLEELLREERIEVSHRESLGDGGFEKRGAAGAPPEVLLHLLLQISELFAGGAVTGAGGYVGIGAMKAIVEKWRERFPHRGEVEIHETEDDSPEDAKTDTNSPS